MRVYSMRTIFIANCFESLYSLLNCIEGLFIHSRQFWIKIEHMRCIFPTPKMMHVFPFSAQQNAYEAFQFIQYRWMRHVISIRNLIHQFTLLNVSFFPRWIKKKKKQKSIHNFCLILNGILTAWSGTIAQRMQRPLLIEMLFLFISIKFHLIRGKMMNYKLNLASV